MSNLRWAVLLLLFTTSSLVAQSYDKVLLPIQPSTIHGAFGSAWHTLLAEKSDDDQRVELKCYPAACVSLDPHAGTLQQANASGDPAFLYVPSAQSPHVFFALRTIVMTANSPDMVMEIPIARVSDFTASVFHLQAIPINRDFRQSLRIYDFEGIDNAAVRVRIYTSGSDPAADTIVFLHKPSTPDVDGRPGAPAFVTINNLTSAFPAIASADIVNIDLEPLSTGVSIWAFVTSTNNLTQQFNHFIH